MCYYIILCVRRHKESLFFIFILQNVSLLSSQKNVVFSNILSLPFFSSPIQISFQYYIDLLPSPCYYNQRLYLTINQRSMLLITTLKNNSTTINHPQEVTPYMKKLSIPLLADTYIFRAIRPAVTAD